MYDLACHLSPVAKQHKAGADNFYLNLFGSYSDKVQKEVFAITLDNSGLLAVGRGWRIGRSVDSVISKKAFARMLDLDARWVVAAAKYETELADQFLIVVRETNAKGLLQRPWQGLDGSCSLGRQDEALYL